MMQRNSSGGTAAAGGFDYQNRVAAWVAVRILAEKDASPPWGLSAGTTLEGLRCETGQPIDDLLVGTSDGGYIFAQIKRTLELEKSTSSDLAKVLDQFVRQFLECRDNAIDILPQDRTLDPNRDYFVLITSLSSSIPIRTHIPAVLRRLRGLQENQSLADAALNNGEKKALSVVLEHLKRCWKKESGIESSEDGLRRMLSLVHIQILDVDAGESGEREARDLLRRVILRNPEQDDAAWARLTSLASRFATQRSGADRLQLQCSLLDDGFDIKHVRSYQPDIERLKEFSGRVFESLTRYSQIRVGDSTVKIQRPCMAALGESVDKGSIIIVGEPGAGKSGALHDLAEVLTNEGREYLSLSVDRLAAQSLGGLRAEIGLEHELIRVLDNWPGLRPAFVLIDSLDAARGEPAEMLVQDLIHEIIQKNGRWRVVASIRKFDLRYGEEYKRLFAGNPPTEFKDPEFAAVRHLNIPSLSEEELGQIASQSHELDALVRSAPTELIELLSTPFNLQLMGELIGAGLIPEELTPIKTELELLDRYWRYRVINGMYGDAREAVLREVCEKMVAERALRLDRSAIALPDSGIMLGELLSRQILVEWQPSPQTPPDRYIVTFPHHVLFDYAVARLLLRGELKKTVQSLTEDPDLVVAIRPSLRFHFRHLWSINSYHLQFWDLVFQIVQEDRVPEIGKLIGPSVAAELAQALSDLELLCVALEDPGNQPAAEEALRHLVGALLAGAQGNIHLLGPYAGPWSELLERVSRSLKPHVADTIRTLLSTMCDHPEDLTPEQRSDAGKTARRLLEFFWAQSPIDTWRVNFALQCVCRTFESNHAESATLLQRCFETSHLSEYDFLEIPCLAHEAKRLIPIDSRFVEELYRVAFTHDVTSEELTPLYPSGILPLTSTRRQDYQMAHYGLAEAFPEFLESAPENATRALIAAMEAYAKKKHNLASRETQEESFEFYGLQARLISDASCFWDEGAAYRHDEPVKMLDAFQQDLEGLEGNDDGMERFRKALRILIPENRLAVLWKRIITVGARFPDTFGREILPLAWTLPVLSNYDTSTSAGEFIRAVFPTLNSDERQRIEQAILSIPETVSTDELKAAEHRRNRLLGCLSIENIVTDDARRLFEELSREDSIPPNEPRKPVAVWSEAYGEEDYLKDEGVPVDAEPNRRIRELEKPVKEFINNNRNSTPTIEEASKVLSALRALYAALPPANADGMHPKQRDHAWGNLAEACASIARIDGLMVDNEPGSFVKDILLEATHNSEPVPDPEYDAQFDEHPSWGSPAARLDAAKGLIVLARHPGFVGPEVLEAIDRLSNDPVPAVRFQIASHLNYLNRTAHEMMWNIVERMCREEPSRGVLQGLITSSLQGIAGVEPDRVADLIKLVYDRVHEGPGASEVRKHCTNIFAGLYIWREQALSERIILNIASSPAYFPDEALRVLGSLRKALTHGPASLPDTKADAVRIRTMNLLELLLRSALDGWCDFKQHYYDVPSNQWPQEDQVKAKSLLNLIDGVGDEVYFASGAYEGRRQRKAGMASIQESESERFYREASKIFDELAETGLPSVAHHLVETLEFFIPIDPHEVFLRIGHVVRAGQEGRYEYESLAVDLIVEIVERYLADHRTLLREDLDCRKTLVEILDTFVQVGWPSARRLTYRLEEIFR